MNIHAAEGEKMVRNLRRFFLHFCGGGGGGGK